MFEEDAPIRRARPIAQDAGGEPFEPPPAPVVVKRMSGRIWPAIADLASNEVYVLASAIAFNALLSFFPFVILLLVLCRNVLQWPEGYEAILRLLREDYLPISQDFIVKNLRAITVAHYGQAAALSLAALAFTSSGLFAPIEMALNRAWGVTEHRSLVRGRLIALGLVVACGALALVSVYITAYSQELLRGWLGGLSELAPVRIVSAVALRVLIFPVTVSIFFLIYYVLPNRRIYVREVLFVAIFTGLLWEATKYLFMWFAPRLGFEEVYGPFYVTVTLVTWAYISASILLLGANLSSRDLRAPLWHDVSPR
jgi:YihY family inner membrane protein